MNTLNAHRMRASQVSAMFPVAGQGSLWSQQLSRRAMGLVLLLVSSVFIMHALYVLRTPDWQSRGWWANHRFLATLLGGRGRLAKAGVWFELVGAVVLLVAAVLLIVLG